MVGVTACIPTRGNVDMEPILLSLPPDWEVVVWDNSVEDDLSVYGRYAAIGHASNSIIYTQDDDCILPPESHEILCELYQPGTLIANMPLEFRAHYFDSCLVGFGAIFDADLPLHAFAKLGPLPPNFDRTCDVYFTTLCPRTLWADVPYENLPWATGPDRMYREAGHISERAAALQHARSLR